jgi:hypothetical protein
MRAADADKMIKNDDGSYTLSFRCQRRLREMGYKTIEDVNAMNETETIKALTVENEKLKFALGAAISRGCDHCAESIKLAPSLAQGDKQKMIGPQANLLLAVALVLQSKISDEIYAERDVHLQALADALEPFDLPYGGVN